MFNEELQQLKNEYPDFFKQTPSDLIELAISEETASNIAEICLKNGIEDEDKIQKIAYRVTLVLLKQMPKENLPKILENGAGIDSEIAVKISDEVNEIIFSQIENKKNQPIELSTPLSDENPTPEKQKIKKTLKKDTYRETVE